MTEITLMTFPLQGCWTRALYSRCRDVTFRISWLLPVVLLLSGCPDAPPASRLVFPPAVSHYSGKSISPRGGIDVKSSKQVDARLTLEGQTTQAVIIRNLSRWLIADFLLPDTTSFKTQLDMLMSFRNSRSGSAIELPLTMDRQALNLRSTDLVTMNGRVFVSDARLRAIVEVDMVTGKRRILAGEDIGTGPQLSLPAYLQTAELQTATSGLYLLDVGLRALLQVDPDTGDRRMISSDDTGSGPALVSPRQFVLTRGVAIVTDTGLDALVEIDLATGDRRIIFNEFVEDGPVILSPKGMVATADNKVLVIDDQYRALISIDLSSGAFRAVSARLLGTGPQFAVPEDLLLENESTALVLDDARGGLLRVDLATGDRSIAVASTDALFGVPVAMASMEGSLIVADNQVGNIIAVDLSTGTKRLVSELAVGTGPRFSGPTDALVIKEVIKTVNQDTYLIADSGLDSLVEVNAQTGVRQIRHAGTADVSFFDPAYLTSSGNTVYLSYSQFDINGIVSINLDDNSRRVLASPDVGSGPVLFTPLDIAFDERRQRLLILDAFKQSLVAVDTNSLERKVVSDADTGLGNPISGSATFALDGTRDVAYVLNSLTGRILEVNLATGDRASVAAAFVDGNVKNRTLVDIAMHDSDGRLLLLDAANKTLLGLFPDSGEIEVLSGEGVGEGEGFENPVRITLVQGDDLALVVDAGLDALFLVDLTTGDRLILSK